MPTSTTRTPNGPVISVILAADTYRATASGNLEPFLEQTAAAETFELIVVDWVGDPRYLPFVERMRSFSDAPRLEYLQTASRSRAVMNNLGVSRASAPILCFCAYDFIPCAAFVESHLTYHVAGRQPTRVAIGPSVSPIEIRQASPFLAWAEDSGEIFGAPLHDATRPLPPGFFYLANTSLKRSFLDQAGRFDERLPFPAYDDWEYGQRLTKLGMESELVPGAACVHDHLITFHERRQHMRWAGISAAILSSVHSSKRRRHLAAMHLQFVRRWLLSGWRSGPRSAWWRLSLTSAFLSAYRQQMMSTTTAD